MSGELLDRVPEIARQMIEYWKKYDTPRNQENLSYDQKIIEKYIEYWISLRAKGIHPNAVRRILQEAFYSKKALDDVLDEWYHGKTQNWWYFGKDENWSTFIYDVCCYLENYVKAPKKPARERGRPKEEYPIEEMKRLREEEGLSYGEIAKRLGIPKTTVYRLLKSVPLKQSEQG